MNNRLYEKQFCEQQQTILQNVDKESPDNNKLSRHGINQLKQNQHHARYNNINMLQYNHKQCIRETE